MRQLRMRFHQLLERADQAQVILARLQVADGQNERRMHAVSGVNRALREPLSPWVEIRWTRHSAAR